MFSAENNPEAESTCRSTRHARNSFGLLPQVFVNEKPLNVKKTTSSVLSVLLLIYVYKVYFRNRNKKKVGRVWNLPGKDETLKTKV